MNKTRIMYIEHKGDDGLVGPARIGRVFFSRSGRTSHYGGKRFRSLRGDGLKSNYYCVETGEHYWVSGCRKDGRDALYGTSVGIDDDVREEYWRDVRGLRGNVDVSTLRSASKY